MLPSNELYFLLYLLFSFIIYFLAIILPTICTMNVFDDTSSFKYNFEYTFIVAVRNYDCCALDGG